MIDAMVQRSCSDIWRTVQIEACARAAAAAMTSSENLTPQVLVFLFPAIGSQEEKTWIVQVTPANRARISPAENPRL